MPHTPVGSAVGASAQDFSGATAHRALGAPAVRSWPALGIDYRENSPSVNLGFCHARCLPDLLSHGLPTLQEGE